MKGKRIKNKQVTNEALSIKPVGNYSVETNTDPEVLKKIKISLTIIIAVFAFLLYFNSINHNFTLDDHFVVDQNNITTKGLASIPTILRTDYWYGSGHEELRGPIYRPTSIVIFAIVWQFSPNSPHIYHFINVLLYAITCLILFLVLCQLFKNFNLTFPFVCSLFYAGHPIHTEVVNNIKSLDEMLCFLFGLFSIWLMLKYSSKKSILAFIAGGISFFLALLSKETGITFLVIIPLCIFFFQDNSKEKIIPISLLLFTLTGIWLIVRMIVFKDLHPNTGVANSALNNTLYAAPDFISKYATVFYILLRYVVLLIFPHPLSCDYNFAQIKIQTLSDAAALIGIILYVGLGTYSIINFRKKNIVAFGILFFLITLSPVSNVFFQQGSSMAERFMYIPSLGFCIVLTYFLVKLTKTEYIKTKFKNLFQFITISLPVFLIVLVISAIYSFKTISRNKDWKDTLTIFGHDVQISENSVTAHFVFGTSLLEDLYPNEKDKSKQDSILNLSIEELKTGMDILKTGSMYAPLYNLKLGNAYLYKRDFQNAMINLEIYRDKYPTPTTQVYSNLGAIYLNLNMYDKTIEAEDSVIKYLPAFSDAYFNKGLALTGKGEYEKAIIQYEKAIEHKPNSAELYYNRAIVFANEKKYEEALKDYNKSIELNPDYVEAYVNRGNILRDGKKYEDAIKDFDKALKIKPDFAKSYFNRGNIFIEQKKYEEAIKDFNQALELNPEYVEAYVSRGFTKIYSGNTESACLDFQKAAALGSKPAANFYKQFCH